MVRRETLAMTAGSVGDRRLTPDPRLWRVIAVSSQISGRVERFPSWSVIAVALLFGGCGAIAMGLVGGLGPCIVASVFAGLGFGLGALAVVTAAVVTLLGRQSSGAPS